MYLLQSKPVFTWNLLDLKRVRWEGAEALSPGKHTIEFDFKYDGLGEGTLAYNSTSGVGRGGIGTLKVDGKVAATAKMDRSIPLSMPLDDAFGIGTGGGTPVDDGDYQGPFAFTGKIDKLTIALDRPELTAEDRRKLEEAFRAVQGAK
jgi:arylsulfatase